MKIVSFNVRQGGTSGAWQALSETFAPDVVLIQEGGKWIADMADDLFEPALRWTWSAVAGNGWGSAIGMRREPARVLDCVEFEGWVCGVELVELHGTLQVYSIHAPSGRGSYEKVVHAILDEIARLRGDAEVIIGGDFNLTVGRRRPGEERRNKPAELELLDRLEGEFGLVSAWSVLNPDEPLPQTLRWVRDRTVPYHCDGIFIPEQWRGALEAVEVGQGGPWESLSDHNPVATKLDVPVWSEVLAAP